MDNKISTDGSVILAIKGLTCEDNARALSKFEKI